MMPGMSPGSGSWLRDESAALSGNVSGGVGHDGKGWCGGRKLEEAFMSLKGASGGWLSRSALGAWSAEVLVPLAEW